MKWNLVKRYMIANVDIFLFNHHWLTLFIKFLCNHRNDNNDDDDDYDI